MASRTQFLLRSLAMLALIAVLVVIIQEASGSSTQQVAQQRVDELQQRISAAELDNQRLDEQLQYARSLPALREMAKRELGLVNPGDQAVVLQGQVEDRPRLAPLPIPTVPPPEPEPIEFGYLGGWMALLFGGD